MNSMTFLSIAVAPVMPTQIVLKLINSWSRDMTHFLSNTEIWMMVLATCTAAIYSYWLVGEAEKQVDR
jgi:hypothetical protein